jgi:flavin reductase (DIM6/NTAB) family NADH-FMN oxidoreductase RutF
VKKEWIKTFGKMTYGIYVLTTFYQDEINAMIASWVSQVSYTPPLIMVAVHPNRYSHHLIENSSCFALHVLSRQQKDYLTRFKGPDLKAKFSAIDWRRGKTGCPILSESVAYLECQLKGKYSPGNHSLFIGEVVDAGIFSEEKPLNTLDYEGHYLGKS